MAFADLKNDFVFRRVFGKHPALLRGLLNDLLEREGEQTIEGLEYLPSEQRPPAEGAKFSILDVRCRDRAGTTFVAKMQLLHVPGFVNRAVYNGCKPYVDHRKAGEAYTRPTDVIALSICDYVLWPDAEQAAAGQPPVPMLSRWSRTEKASGHGGLVQVQYAFLELPKLAAERPATGAGYWAWLFVHARTLREVPADLPPGPYREALTLAREASFTTLEREAYRRVMDEIQQTRDYGDAREAEGKARGRREGEARARQEGEARARAEGLRAAVLDACELLGLEPTAEQRARLAAMSPGELEALRQALKQSRRWPG